MSHMTTIEITISDLDALARAAARCGCELVRGQTSFRWYGTFVGDSPVPQGMTVEDYGRCEHAIRVQPDTAGPPRTPYEVGVRRGTKPGTWTLHYDNWQGGYGLEKAAGKGLATLKSMYAREVARGHAQRAGLRYTETQNADGSVRVTLGG